MDDVAFPKDAPEHLPLWPSTKLLSVGCNFEAPFPSFPLWVFFDFQTDIGNHWNPHVGFLCCRTQKLLFLLPSPSVGTFPKSHAANDITKIHFSHCKNKLWTCFHTWRCASHKYLMLCLTQWQIFKNCTHKYSLFSWSESLDYLCMKKKITQITNNTIWC